MKFTFTTLFLLSTFFVGWADSKLGGVVKVPSADKIRKHKPSDADALREQLAAMVADKSITPESYKEALQTLTFHGTKAAQKLLNKKLHVELGAARNEINIKNLIIKKLEHDLEEERNANEPLRKELEETKEELEKKQRILDNIRKEIGFTPVPSS